MRKLMIGKNPSSDIFSTVRKMLVAFVILQPILDLYMSVFDDYIQIAGVSAATIFRFLMVFLMALLIVIKTRKSKLTWCFIAYFGVVAVYTVIHHFHALGFSVELPEAQYNMMEELLFLARLCLPPALIYIVYHVKPTYKDIRLIVLTVSVIMSTVILVGSLFKFGYVAYNIDKQVIEYNMIDWFRDIYVDWELLTCRGIFQVTNQISPVMLIILPSLIYVCQREKKVLYWIFLTAHMLAMMNLGTRIAGLASILCLIGLSFMYIVEKLLYKKPLKGDLKNYLCIILSILIVMIVFLNSPLKQRMDEDGLLQDSVKKHSAVDIANDTATYAEKVAYIEENFPKTQINPYYIFKSYPYTEDADFWYKIIKYTPYEEYIGNRNQRTLMVQRILERDGRASNYIWGISYSRSTSFVWPERDLETHLDSLGIAGILVFFGPHFFGILFGLWHFLRKFWLHFKLSHYVYLCSSILAIIAGYCAGYVLHEIFPFVFLSLMVGMTINTALETKEAER